ncbi:Ig-like domain-containing protein [Photorhabdus namnaonensis]|uniref:Bacterial Ig-like domain (Group 1) n=1 Tax=Photorhabdus namnaonensis TaxID=1851568 RepID=A0A1B8YB03_9GAMM|nr:Ig-like domain-containing protein [Photorhabdus namnaonensis]OCA52319.1 Bacterial Ig-like domain (group 1) [Photorhabdus namnaonensis]
MDDEQAPKEAKTLNWLSSEKTETMDKPIDIGVSAIQDGYLLHGVNVVFTLDNQSMVFKENNDRKIIKGTGILGKVSVEIISTDSTPCQGNVYACLEDDTQIAAPPLQVEFISILQSVAGLKLVLKENNAWINSTDENKVVATVYDRLGNGVKNQKITFYADSGATVVPSSGMTDKNGKITALIQSNSAGEVTLMAQVGDIKKAVAMCFTDNPYQLKIIESQVVLSSFSNAIIAGYLYKNGVGEPNVTISVSLGSYLFLSSQDKHMTTDINGYFSFRIATIERMPPMNESVSVYISCIDGRVYSQTWVELTPELY